MPLYSTLCEDCDAKASIWRRVADRDVLPNCDKCNGVLIRVVSAPYIAPDIQSYISPATGKVINSRVQMRDDLERSGHIMREPGIEKDIQRNKQYRADEAFKPLEAAVDAAVNQAVVSGALES